jgi:DNA mismatch repair ATPase MutS
MQMGFRLETSGPVYTYKVKQGISNLKGGIAVLKELDYPETLIKDARTILKEYV